MEKFNVKSGIIRHHFPKECNWMRVFGSNVVKSYIVFLPVVDMTYCHNCLH